MKKLAILCLLAVAGISQAQTFWSGAITANDPVFNRPVSGGGGLSGVGTAVSYDVQPFWVSVSGAYTFEMGILLGLPTFDTFNIIYANSFNPASPLTNHVASNDDFSGTLTVLNQATHQTGAATRSRSQANLTAGVQYFAVSTTFANGERGEYSNGIGGPGQVTLGAVPEPATMTALAVGALGLLARRRRKA